MENNLKKKSIILLGTGLLITLFYTGYNYNHRMIENKERAAAMPPSQSKSTNELFAQANQLYKQKKYQEAINTYHELLKLQPHHPQAHVSTGLAAARLGSFDHALHHAQKTVELDRKYVAAHMLLGQCYEQKKEQGKAKEAYQEALSLEPNLFEAHLFLSQLLSKEETSISCAQAVMHAQKALEIKPMDKGAQDTFDTASNLAKELLEKTKAEASA